MSITNSERKLNVQNKPIENRLHRVGLRIDNDGCSSNDDDDDTGEPVVGEPSQFIGAVYAMDNAADINSVVAYGRNENGTLTLIGTESTEGQGTGPNNVASGPGGNVFDPLASNFSLKMSADNQFLFAVNAGSDEISSFVVNDDFSLSHVSTVSTGGTDPVSIATNGSSVFVANSNEGVGSLTAFSVDTGGTLSNVGEAVALEGRPTAVIVSADGNSLVTALVDTNQLQVFDVSATSITQTQLFSYAAPPEGRVVQNPFGLAAYENEGGQFIVVAEARVFTVDGEVAPQTSSVATISLSGGTLTQVSEDIRADVDNDDSVGPITSCWVVTNSDGTLAVTANTFSNDLSSFTLDQSGNAQLATSRAFLDPAEDFNDVGLTDQILIDGVIYQMAASTGEIISLQLGDAGQLTEIDRESGDLSSIIGGNQGVAGF